MVFHWFSWKSGDFRLIFQLNPKVSANFHIEIEENQPGTFWQAKKNEALLNDHVLIE
jgi:hypothetical protein